MSVGDSRCENIGPGSPSVGVYLPSTTAYADEYLSRQAASFENAFPIVGPWSAKLDARKFRTGNRLAVNRRLGSFIDRAGRRLGVWDLDPYQKMRIRAGLRESDVAYTLFLHRGYDLVRSQSRNGNVPLVVHAGGSDVTALASSSHRVALANRVAARSAALVLCGSRFIEERLTEVEPNAETLLHYIGLPIPSEVVKHVDKAAVQFIAVSRLHPVKGVDHTIRSFSKAFGVGSENTLVIVGDGPLRRDLRVLAESLRGGERIHFLGHLPVDEVKTMMLCSDVFVQHNVSLESGVAEALGGSILEAAALGLPVIATRSGGVAEGIAPSARNLLVVPGDEDSMADQMRELALSSELRGKRGSVGRSFARERFDARKQDQRLWDVLVQVASS